MDQKRNCPLVRIKADVAEQVRTICEKTRQPISDVVSDALRFALVYVKLIPTQLYDVTFSTEDAKHGSADNP